MRFGKYVVKIIKRNMHDVVILSDFVRMRIIDILNESGSWKITSVTKDPCPFEIGDFIEVLRDEIPIYSGYLTSMTEEYDLKSKSWKWDVSGKSLIQILKWRLVWPPFSSYGQIHGERSDDSCLMTVEREYEQRGLYLTDTIPNIIRYLIYDNVAFSRAPAGRITFGWLAIRNVLFLEPTESGDDISVYYRFDNIYDTIISLLQQFDHYIYAAPAENYDGIANGFVYCCTKGSDLSDVVVFDEAFDQVNAFRRSMTSPEVTTVVSNMKTTVFPEGHIYQGIEDANFEYFGRMEAAKRVKNSEKWIQYQQGSGYVRDQEREVFKQPKKEDFDRDFMYWDFESLEKICQELADGINIDDESFEIDVNVKNSYYTYGYKWADSSYQSFSTDYRLGDIIGIRVNGIKLTGKLTKIEFDVSYGKETITETFGGMAKGKFNEIFASLKNQKRSGNAYEREVPWLS